MKIDLERQMDRCREVTARVLANQDTLEQLCIDTRGLLYMADVVMTSMSSIMTKDIKDSIREVLDNAAKAAEARQSQGQTLNNIEKGSAERVIRRVSEFDAAYQEMEQVRLGTCFV